MKIAASSLVGGGGGGGGVGVEREGANSLSYPESSVAPLPLLVLAMAPIRGDQSERG